MVATLLGAEWLQPSLAPMPQLCPPPAAAAAGQFLAAVRPSSGGELEIVGFCCGTLSTANRLTEESMAQHEPEGGLLAIHSVCVAAALRRQRVATRLLRAYLQFVLGTTPQLQEVRCVGEGEPDGAWPCCSDSTWCSCIAGTHVLCCSLVAVQVRLICKEPLVPLYSGAGLEMVGPSDVVSKRGGRNELGLLCKWQWACLQVRRMPCEA